MDAMHTVIQIAMGWTDSHLHSFSKGGNCWTIPDPDAYTVSLDLDERKFRLHEVLRKVSDSLLYVYDFGDDWRHKVTLEKVLPGTGGKPTCVAGKGDCPPEDCGGFFEPEEAEEFSLVATAAALEHERWETAAL